MKYPNPILDMLWSMGLVSIEVMLDTGYVAPKFVTNREFDNILCNGWRSNTYIHGFTGNWCWRWRQDR